MLLRVTQESVTPNLTKFLRSTVYVGGSKRINPSRTVPPFKHISRIESPEVVSSLKLNKIVQETGVSLKSVLGSSFTQVRYAHTDIQVPDFDKYRRHSSKNPKKKGADTVDSRRLLTCVVTAVGMTTFWYGCKSHALHYIFFIGPSREVLALAKVEVKLGDIPEGKSGTAKWRGKPLFIRHRTQDEIDAVRAVPLSSLRDPESDDSRVKRPEWLITVGICTHLGCIPIPYLGDYNGYYCPCHGSHFDASGRIRRGPAPSNLVVPEYTFTDDNTIIVG